RALPLDHPVRRARLTGLALSDAPRQRRALSPIGGGALLGERPAYAAVVGARGLHGAWSVCPMLIVSRPSERCGVRRPAPVRAYSGVPADRSAKRIHAAVTRAAPREPRYP